MSWSDQLQQASFRGIPFGVLGARSRFGRRLAIHEYPFRDQPWAEDLGRSTRRLGLTGFLVENDLVYGGGPVIAQRELMIAACEVEGPGTLVHPTLGALTVSVAEFGVSEKWDDGRYFELEFSFVEAGERLFPSLDIATGPAVIAAALAADLAAASDFDARVTADLLLGPAVMGQIVVTGAAWGAIATGLAGDATGLINLVATLQGNYGRYFGGRNYGGFTGAGSIRGNATLTVSDLVDQGTASRAAIAAAVTNLSTVGNDLGIPGADPTAYAAAAQAIAAAVLAATADPEDGIRLLAELAAFEPAQASAPDPIGIAMTDAQDATGDLCRRAAVVALARAAMTYQPASYNDAVALRDWVTGLLDNEITVAGDEGEDGSYEALRALRLAVVQDLTQRGGDLAPIATFTTGAPLPALVLAVRYYRDAGRADQLVTQVDPIHPAFMPTTFQALAN